MWGGGSSSKGGRPSSSSSARRPVDVDDSEQKRALRDKSSSFILMTVLFVWLFSYLQRWLLIRSWLAPLVKLGPALTWGFCFKLSTILLNLFFQQRGTTFYFQQNCQFLPHNRSPYLSKSTFDTSNFSLWILQVINIIFTVIIVTFSLGILQPLMRVVTLSCTFHQKLGN